MLMSLQEAADLAGVNKTTLFRAIKSGKISASRDEHAQWRVDPAEVSRVYPIAPGAAEQQRAMPRRRDRTDELIAQLREQLAQMERALDRASNDADRCRNDAEAWRKAFEDEKTQRLALLQPPAARLVPAGAGVVPPGAPSGGMAPVHSAPAERRGLLRRLLG